MKANRIKKMSTDSRGIFILKKNISCSLFAVCRREFRLFFCYFDLLPLLLFVPIGLTWDTQCNITAFKLLWKKWWYFEHRVIACRSDKVLVSIVCNDLAFLSNLAGCFSHWDRVVGFFSVYFRFPFGFSLFWCIEKETQRNISRESSMSSLFVRLTSQDYKK